ncbi:hypothetical protein H6G33_10255 [Calothrix sp. FACHB-1219]|uniref:hypothetical protein n=1 Tax=unclassified Calothrix TaxID=2619626 RepID=UPI001683D592|nr:MULTISPECIES: hypothetical protein [unclassified Calothrix]MBD2201729.1 hypothetical protein [Calothrix sp. FACHB-168]MBD2217415.1 hypothetical protein [Calothrix sp. FACHB-1219]
MDSIEEYYSLSLEEQSKYVGLLQGENFSFVCIHLDEASQKILDLYYGALTVRQTRFSRFNRNRVYVYIPGGLDRCSFRAILPIEADLIETMDKIYYWADRYGFRWINVHALEDYCKYELDAVAIEWS